MTEWLHFHFSLSCIGEGNGNPLQCSCLENPREGGGWWSAIYGVAQSRTRLKRLSISSSCWHWKLLPWCQSCDIEVTSKYLSVQFSSVHSLSHVWLCNPMDYSMPGFSVHHQLPEFTQTHVYWVNDAIQPSHPLSSPSLPSFNLSQHQGLFKWVSSSNQVAKLLEFQHRPPNEYSGLISLRMGWLDLLAVQGTLKSHLQHHSSKISILPCWAFFIVQLSHLYITTGLLMVTFINSSTIDYFGLWWKSSHNLTKKRKRKFICARSFFEVAAYMKDRSNDYT